MKLKQLPDDYEITVDNMIPLNIENENFEVSNERFYSTSQKKYFHMDILINKDGENGWQIFSMNDGTFVLEIEDFDMGNVDYFQSDNLQDILDTYEV